MKIAGIKRRTYPVLYWSLLAAALAVRMVVCGQNRSLFIDEANLARNLCEKGWLALLAPLDYQQYAPPGFCFLVKGAVATFGAHEYALRLVPLLAGLFTTVLFFVWVKKQSWSPWVALPVLWIFSFSETLIRYASECKQYGMDAFVALGLLYLADRGKTSARAWALLGVAAVWFSMPAVFILFAIGIFQWVHSSGRQGRRQWVGVSLCWLLSFLLYYLCVLRYDLSAEALRVYHAPWFFPLFPTSKDEAARALSLLRTVPYYTAGHTVVALLAGTAGMVSGLWSDRRWVFLAGLPLLTAIVASSLGLYSLIPRMLLWLFPLMMWVQGSGWAWWWGRSGYWPRVLLFSLLLLTASTQQGYRYFIVPLEVESCRTLLDQIALDYRATDRVYVDHQAMPAVRFYTECYAGRDAYRFADAVEYSAWDAIPDTGLLSGAGRAWLLFGHLPNWEEEQAVREKLQPVLSESRVLAERREEGALLYLISKK